MYRVYTMCITIYNNLAQDVLHITKTIQRQNSIQIQIELQMNDYIAANFNLVLLRWPVHDITLNLPRHGEDHQTLNIWTVSDYSSVLANEPPTSSLSNHVGLCLSCIVLYQKSGGIQCQQYIWIGFIINWTQLVWNWSYKCRVPRAKLEKAQQRREDLVLQCNTVTLTLCYMLCYWALGLSRWWRSGLDHIQWKFATHGNGTQSHHMWLEQGLIGWERSWIYREKGSPVFWLLQQPAWLENGFETELGTFKLEMEWNYHGNKVVINSDE